jgi:Protein of unknown function (DUF4240)
MREQDFWNLIDQARDDAQGDPYEVCNCLEALLHEQSPEAVLAFDGWLYKSLYAAYRADVWGAAYIMNGGCSDDGFEYFRGWLVTQGKAVFDAALADPDSLADAIDEEADQDEFEDQDILNLALRVWAEQTNADEDSVSEQASKRGQYPALGDFEWSSDDGDIDEVKGKALYPKLWAQFME